jgi:hypothetical protein
MLCEAGTSLVSQKEEATGTGMEEFCEGETSLGETPGRTHDLMSV